MEVFKAFAVMSLVDLISGPLGKMKDALKGVDFASASLGQKFGKLTLAMAPLALAAGVVLGSFGVCTAVAAGFEDQMAKVGAVSRATASEMEALTASARELGATTQFTASQVGEAEMYLAMAGFTAEQNIAALPGVLNLAAATATDLGRASDISSDILSGFGLEAAEMSRVADVLALTCSTANTNLELLGDTMKYVGPVARMAGMSIEETAAMAGLLGNVGIKGSMAGTSLKAMLNKIAAPAGEAQKVLKSLGISVQDSAGNLRSPLVLLGEMSKKLEGMGTAQQIAALKTIVGEEAIAGFAELINQEGVGAISKYVEQLNAAGGTAEEMARRMNDTFAGDGRNMSSAWESLQITIGNLFLPVLRLVVQGITKVLQWFDKLAQSPLGAAVLKIAAGLSTVILAVTAFSAAMWGASIVGPKLAKALAPLRAIVMGISWPVWVVIGALAALYLAYKTNFGGIADTIDGWWNTISLVFNGVREVVASMTGGVGQIRGELGKDIKAAGLLGVVTNISKLFYRAQQFVVGFVAGVKTRLDAVGAVFGRVFDKVGALLKKIGGILSGLLPKFGGGEVTSAASEWEAWGNILGMVAGWLGEALGTALLYIINQISVLIDIVRLVCAIFTGDWAAAGQIFDNILTTMGESILAIADLFGFGGWLRESWQEAMNFISGIDLFESGKAIINTLIDGISSMAGGLVDSVTGVFSSVRDLLPFSDAKTGPFSALTLSGGAIMTTLGQGVESQQGAFVDSVAGAFDLAAGAMDGGLTTTLEAVPVASAAPVTIPSASLTPVPLSAIPEPRAPDAPAGYAKGRGKAGDKQNGGVTNYFSFGDITLPDVKDVEGFVSALQNLISEHDGVPA